MLSASDLDKFSKPGQPHIPLLFHSTSQSSKFPKAIRLNSTSGKEKERKKERASIAFSTTKKGHVVGHVFGEKIVSFVNTVAINPSIYITIVPHRAERKTQDRGIVFLHVQRAKLAQIPGPKARTGILFPFKLSKYLDKVWIHCSF